VREKIQGKSFRFNLVTDSRKLSQIKKLSSGKNRKDVKNMGKTWEKLSTMRRQGPP
jgi:hypothetical protein